MSFNLSDYGLWEYMNNNADKQQLISKQTMNLGVSGESQVLTEIVPSLSQHINKERIYSRSLTALIKEMMCFCVSYEAWSSGVDKAACVRSNWTNSFFLCFCFCFCFFQLSLFIYFWEIINQNLRQLSLVKYKVELKFHKKWRNLLQFCLTGPGEQISNSKGTRRETFLRFKLSEYQPTQFIICHYPLNHFMVERECC